MKPTMKLTKNGKPSSGQSTLKRVAARRRRHPSGATHDRPPSPTLARFLRAQVVNTERDLDSLRPFGSTEFGEDAASPSAAHIQEVNKLIGRLRERLAQRTDAVQREAESSAAAPSTEQLHGLLQQKQAALSSIKLLERIWDYYLELFGQRQTRFGNMLLGLDRMSLDCYQAVYTGLGRARSIPAPPPLTYMETGFTPSTFRRGVKMSRLGKNMNPFPIVQLPYHRLVNPWTLGAVHHEVAHNIQSDLGLWQEVPRQIVRRLREAGAPPSVARTWGRWHKETWADLSGTLLGGPGIVTSLLDVLARSPQSTLRFNPGAVHPTPYLRTLISTELLRRMGFEREAGAVEGLWRRLYPSPGRTIPDAMLQTFPHANALVVDTICYQPYAQLGGKSLADVFSFNANHQQMTSEAAHRMARGVDPGIIPARFLVGAARHALDERLAPPRQIAKNFYAALKRR